MAYGSCSSHSTVIFIVHLLIAAAGSGRRMGGDRNKLLLPLCGKEVLSWTLDAAISADSINWIGIIGQSRDQEAIAPLLQSSPKTIKWILGGSTRQESVANGLNALPPKVKKVLIHDGARCLVDPNLFNRVAEAIKHQNAIIAACPVTDTIKQVNNAGGIINTLERKTLWAAQTPQAFNVDQLKEAHKYALQNNWEVTDDASLFERLGLPVQVLESSNSNIKVTTKFDLSIAELILSKKK